MPEQWNIKIKTENIGPLSALNFGESFEISSNKKKVAVFAKNGSGKTMLSKLFSLTNLTDAEKASYRTEKLVSKGKNNASFEFKCSASTENSKNLSIQLVRNGLITINNQTGLKFHVFNDEYIKSNIEANKYKPDDKISGYIIGKINIDLTKDEGNLKTLKNELDKSNEKIEKAFASSKNDLDNLKISKNTKEYSYFTKDSILVKPNYTGEPYLTLVEKHNKLKSMPDNLSDIGSLIYVIDDKIMEIFELLDKIYSKSKIAEDFRKTVSENLDFIKKGVEVVQVHKKTCPFCGQALNEKTNNLIGQYISFLENTEAKTLEKIKNQIKHIENQIKLVEVLENDILDITAAYDKLRVYLPSFEKTKLATTDKTGVLKNIFNQIKSKLGEKEKDITKSVDITKEKDSLIFAQNEIQIFMDSINKEISKINKAKNDLGSEKLALNRHLCAAKQHEVATLVEEEVVNNKDLTEKIKIQTANIEEQKAKVKKDKKKAVAGDLQKYLKFFFGEKYKFREKDFAIIFKEEQINGELEDILSTGEKSIIAFCYYLASIHTLVEAESDYEKLCYIIDDPISSMDFTYVFCVARLIDCFCDTVAKEKKNLIFVFTHNSEFMNILSKNKLVGLKFILANGEIKKITRELISPYEEHLRDVLSIADSKEVPTHTTANSIRYILESIWKFVTPDKENFEEFILSEEIFKDNEYIAIIVNDFSHGSIRTERGYTDDHIINACRCLIKYIDTKLPGQSKMIDKNHASLA